MRGNTVQGQLRGRSAGGPGTRGSPGLPSAEAEPRERPHSASPRVPLANLHPRIVSHQFLEKVGGREERQTDTHPLVASPTRLDLGKPARTRLTFDINFFERGLEGENQEASHENLNRNDGLHLKNVCKTLCMCPSRREGSLSPPAPCAPAPPRPALPSQLRAPHLAPGNPLSPQ